MNARYANDVICFRLITNTAMTATKGSTTAKTSRATRARFTGLSQPVDLTKADTVGTIKGRTPEKHSEHLFVWLDFLGCRAAAAAAVGIASSQLAGRHGSPRVVIP